MVDERIAAKNASEAVRKDKVVALFEFIGELNKLKQKVVLNVKDYSWWYPIADLPNDTDNIKIYNRDRVEADVLLSVHKPEFQRCPAPDPIFEQWLDKGWDDYHGNADIKEFTYRHLSQVNLSKIPSDKQKNRLDETNKFYKVFFSDDLRRVEAYKKWCVVRNIWAEKQRLTEQTRNIFFKLYNVYIDLERDSETLELIVADGFIRDRLTPTLDHPILTRRVKIRFDALENIIYIEDTDVSTKLYAAIFQNMENIDLASIDRLCDDQDVYKQHPLDNQELPKFFESFAHTLSSKSKYCDFDVPDRWGEGDDRLLLYRKPCFILRKRVNDAVKAIEQIVEHVKETGEVPSLICDIVDGGKNNITEDTEEPSIEERLAAVGGESIDILLSKEANREQLEIARRIERYNAVLVQGPPGTGKTHTIANLMGHFLAQGKSVLVTSYTKKALSVLKEKVAPGLQSLCVSMLDDSNVDMEKSVNGITNYMARANINELKKEMNLLDSERKEIIRELADIRKKLFAIINKECNCVVYNGEAVSPSAAATFVCENSEKLDYIPGKVTFNAPLPLNFEELTELYRSNDIISVQDESEFENDIPDPKKLLSPLDFEQKLDFRSSAISRIKAIENENHWQIQNLTAEGKILITLPYGQLELHYPSDDALENLKEYVVAFPEVEEWMQYCAVDGKKGGSYQQRWMRLIVKIQATCVLADKVVGEKFGKDIKITNQQPDFVDAVKELKNRLEQDSKINRFFLWWDKKLKIAKEGATINNKPPQTVEDCQLIIDILNLKSLRDECAICWNDLMGQHNVPRFYDLDEAVPESIAFKHIRYIKYYLGWYQSEYKVLVERMTNAGLPCDSLFQNNPLDSDIISTKKILLALKHELPAICEIFVAAQIIAGVENAFSISMDFLQHGKRNYSVKCKDLHNAIAKYDSLAYSGAYKALEATYTKSEKKFKREEYLKRLSTAAQQWADAIRNREGIHGGASVPADIVDAWKCKQYDQIIGQLIAEPFSELQKKSLNLSREYRRTTEKFAEKSAWYYLLDKIRHDTNMQQALVGWKETVQRIGKGTGKNAPKFRAKARSLMAKCQNAVPGWIMPIGKALENFNPVTNKFDIVIIDEASQCDISSLPILYMGKKQIIVGDDKQVSPMAVGVEVDKITSLQDLYIKGKIPNDHLYDVKTSIYDVVASTAPSLMLQEHFRCVPEIIGFSNWLSYDGKIKPLRDCSNSVILPAVVNYRVDNGRREGDNKTNSNEAEAIVALLQACIAQPEYAGKTFGVISLLGDEQVKVLQAKINKYIDAKECSVRKILCGNASNFQGDERDIVFLSVVDSANGNGPIRKQGYGVDDAFRKRYNVAASRARDQLWVVDSLDPANDLQSDDIRKKLIDYSINPKIYSDQIKKIEQKAASPFEASVAKALVAKGYHLEQQREVGAYRLDMVAICDEEKVAIECDGERYHSGEEKIREDMERQTILERLGWRFIRIRGSEYYRNPEKAIERVINELSERGIEPEENNYAPKNADRETELLQRVKRQAFEILKGRHSTSDIDSDIVKSALGIKNNEMSQGELIKTSAEDEVGKGSKPVNYPSTQSTVPLTKTQNSRNRLVDKSVVNGAKKRTPVVKPTPQKNHLGQMVLPLGEESEADESKKVNVIEFLKNENIPYTDKRSKGGALWIVGGKEFEGVVQKLKKQGYIFNYTGKGGRATKHQPGWYMK